jgi:hypothetical protein
VRLGAQEQNIAGKTALPDPGRHFATGMAGADNHNICPGFGFSHTFKLAIILGLHYQRHC